MRRYQHNLKLDLRNIANTFFRVLENSKRLSEQKPNFNILPSSQVLPPWHLFHLSWEPSVKGPLVKAHHLKSKKIIVISTEGCNTVEQPNDCKGRLTMQKGVDLEYVFFCLVFLFLLLFFVFLQEEKNY